MHASRDFYEHFVVHARKITTCEAGFTVTPHYGQTSTNPKNQRREELFSYKLYSMEIVEKIRTILKTKMISIKLNLETIFY